MLMNRGFDLVWLMGVWQRSPEARKIALNHQGLREHYTRILPGWNDDDVTGSPYAVYSYEIDSRLGSKEEFLQVKSRLNQLGIKLILDFVPNHLAIDHSWTFSNPARFINGNENLQREHPGWFFKSASGAILAHGRDPYFPPWSDTVQVNFFSEDMRAALIGELLKVAELCDGVRCDMAMLGLNDVFAWIWGAFLGNVTLPNKEFWALAIREVKRRYPKFIFMAEVYWDLEKRLQDLGFDFTYDKKLYDLLLHSGSADLRDYLKMDAALQNGMVRFIENHDEQRAVSAFGVEKSKAAAVVMATIPGMHLFHDGQFEGKKIHLPIQLQQEPHEGADREIADFYEKLLDYARVAVMHYGKWMFLECQPFDSGNSSHRNILAWCWHDESDVRVIMVNYSQLGSQARISIPECFFSKAPTLRLRDHLTKQNMPPVRKEEIENGIPIHLEPWQSCLLQPV